jgi:hypothetical protein
MKKRFTEEQIIGFLREAEAGLPVNCAASTVSRRPAIDCGVASSAA